MSKIISKFETKGDYIILRRESAENLVITVCDWMNQGWEPIGGVSVVPGKVNDEGKISDVGDFAFIHTQAMVRNTLKDSAKNSVLDV